MQIQRDGEENTKIKMPRIIQRKERFYGKIQAVFIVVFSIISLIGVSGCMKDSNIRTKNDERAEMAENYWKKSTAGNT